ncbi:MAG: transaldolase, partial [Nocardioidaceae bacterium]|nr:transaldolase [Nocardioidaceae bacterium]
SVNVTLIFGLGRYDGVMDAYLEGLEKAKDNGHDLSKIHSVASFFVSRVDTEIDKRLDALGDPQAGNLKGKAGVANARHAYRAYEEKFAGERFQALKAAGANTQRPLWASTGVKNPEYRDTMYVTDLLVANVVNTMPEKTLQAFADHGEVLGDQVTTKYAEADQVMGDLAKLGIEYDDVIAVLEREGVDKFVKSWDDLVTTVREQLEAAAGSKQ